MAPSYTITKLFLPKIGRRAGRALTRGGLRVRKYGTAKPIHPAERISGVDPLAILDHVVARSAGTNVDPWAAVE